MLLIFKLPFPNGIYPNGVCRALWALLCSNLKSRKSSISQSYFFCSYFKRRKQYLTLHWFWYSLNHKMTPEMMELKGYSYFNWQFWNNLNSNIDSDFKDPKPKCMGYIVLKNQNLLGHPSFSKISWTIPEQLLSSS